MPGFIDENGSWKIICTERRRLLGSSRNFASQEQAYEVPAGTYELRIEALGFEPFEAVVEVLEGRTLHYDIELAEQDRPPEP